MTAPVSRTARSPLGSSLRPITASGAGAAGRIASSCTIPACRLAKRRSSRLPIPPPRSRRIIWSGRTGRSTNWSAESARAWHAGKARWKGESDLNSASIGVEIVNPGHDGGSPPFPERQIAATIALARDVCARWGIAPERVLAHSDVAPARKQDPGEVFPWERLWRAGVGHWTEPAPLSGGALFAHEEEGPPVRALQAMLALYGYGVEITGDLRPPDAAVGRRVPAPLPAERGSMARRTPRPSRR